MQTLRVRLHRDLADYHDTAIAHFTSENALWQSLMIANVLFMQAEEDEVWETLAEHMYEQGKDVCDDLGPNPMESVEDCDEYLVSVDGELESFIEEYIGDTEELSYFFLRGFFLLNAVDDFLGREPGATLPINGRRVPLLKMFTPEYLNTRLSS